MTRAEKIEVAARALERCFPEDDAWPEVVALRAALMPEETYTERLRREGRCAAEDHPVFNYPCTLPKGHTGPHDNGSGDPWYSEARP